jgi:hypothetical protein
MGESGPESIMWSEKRLFGAIYPGTWWSVRQARWKPRPRNALTKAGLANSCRRRFSPEGPEAERQLVQELENF